MDLSKEVTMADIVRPLIMQDVGETRTNLIPNVNVKYFVGVIVCQKNVSCELKKDAPASHSRYNEKLKVIYRNADILERKNVSYRL